MAIDLFHRHKSVEYGCFYTYTILCLPKKKKKKEKKKRITLYRELALTCLDV